MAAIWHLKQQNYLCCVILATVSTVSVCGVLKTSNLSTSRATQQRRLVEDVEGFSTSSLPTSDFWPTVPRLDRWVVGNTPLHERKLGLQWFDMCAESLGMPKVALMFLSRGPVHQELLWNKWLNQAKGRVMLPVSEPGARSFTDEEREATLKACKTERSTHKSVAKLQHMFTLYLHPSDPTYQPSSSSLFAEAVVPNRLPNGEFYKRYELVEAGLSLLAAALEDRLNQKFVMLCDSTIPLYPPTLIYQQFLHEAKSRLGLYYPEVVPSDFVPGYWHEDLARKYGIEKHHFRKNNHRTALLRKHALLAVKDSNVMKAFYRDCSDCLVEEHYLATVLGAHDVLKEAYSKASVMFEDWERSVDGHPHEYMSAEVTPDLLMQARSFQLSHDWYITKERCNESQDSLRVTSADALMDHYTATTISWKSKNSPYERFQPLAPDCLMFARKFKSPTVEAVLDLWRHIDFRTWNYTSS